MSVSFFSPARPAPSSGEGRGGQEKKSSEKEENP